MGMGKQQLANEVTWRGHEVNSTPQERLLFRRITEQTQYEEQSINPY
jgi:hypothetical protein